MTPPTRFERVMFALLVPAIIAVGLFATLLPHIPATIYSDGLWMVAEVYFFVLVGSMTLNAWLILRDPQTLASRSLTPTLSRVHAALYGALLVAFVTTAGGILSGVDVVAGAAVLSGFAIAVLSVASLMAVALRTRSAVPTERLREAPLTAGVGGILFGVIVSAVLVGAAYAVFATPMTEGFWIPPLLLVGLPLSWPFAMLVAVPVGIAGDYGLVTDLLLVPLAVTVAASLTLLVSERARVYAANRFLRRGRAPIAEQDAAAEDR